jgi:hypothetical protein
VAAGSSLEPQPTATSATATQRIIRGTNGPPLAIRSHSTGLDEWIDWSPSPGGWPSSSVEAGTRQPVRE